MKKTNDKNSQQTSFLNFDPLDENDSSLKKTLREVQFRILKDKE